MYLGGALRRSWTLARSARFSSRIDIRAKLFPTYHSYRQMLSGIVARTGSPAGHSRQIRQLRVKPADIY
jgi:hypothetical protein